MFHVRYWAELVGCPLVDTRRPARRLRAFPTARFNLNNKNGRSHLTDYVTLKV